MENIASYIPTFTTETKPLTNREKRWILQNEIFELLKQDDELKRENWRRYIKFLKKYRLPQNILGIKECAKRWRATKEKDLKKIKELTKPSLGFFTAHLDESALWYVKSVCVDKLNRGESPTCYIYSLSTVSKG